MTLIVRGTELGGLSVTGSLPSVARLSGRRLTRGFASPPHGGFSLIGDGLTYDSRRGPVLPQRAPRGIPPPQLGGGGGGGGDSESAPLDAPPPFVYSVPFFL